MYLNTACNLFDISIWDFSWASPSNFPGWHLQNWCHISGPFGQQIRFLAEEILSFPCLLLALLKNIEELNPVKLCLEVRINPNTKGKGYPLLEEVAA